MGQNVNTSSYCKLNRERIVAIIKEQGLRRWWVAEQIGVHITSLRKQLNGSVEMVRTPTVIRLAETLGVPLEEIATIGGYK